jgi:ABC-type multidrug transport system fused ATPase/permease subunit
VAEPLVDPAARVADIEQLRFMPSPRDISAVLRVLCHETDRFVAWRLAATALLVVAGGLLAGLAPLALKGMIDTVTGAQKARDPLPSIPATSFAVAYLAALCGGRLLNELRPPLIGAAEQRLYARLRRRFFGHLLELPLSFHLGQRTGALVHSLQQAITGYQIIIFNLVHTVVPVLVELVTVTLVLVSLGQSALMATFALTALAYLAVLGFWTFQLEDGAHAVSDANLDAHGMLTDCLLNCETVKCFSAERTARDRFTAVTGVLEDRWVDLHRERARMGLALSATFALSMAASLASAVHATANGTLSVGGFVMANVYMLQVVRPLEMLGAASRDLTQALAFIRPLLDVLNEATETPETCGNSMRSSSRHWPPRETKTEFDHTATVIDRGQSPGIRFRDVHFSYDDGKPVLHALSLDIAAGRTVALVGASGCGKSSLARLLFRLYEPQAGCILMDDVAIDTMPVGELRSMVGLVPQETVLFNDTIAFNIGIGKAGACQSDIERAARVARLHDFICRLPAGYDTVVGERGLKVSGGQRQRIAIARAVLKDPWVYVFDEATSMLDSLTELAILQNLRAVSAGCTTITIAHRLSSVKHADEIVVLDKGKVVERGDHDALLASEGAYARLWHAQLRGGIERIPER